MPQLLKLLMTFALLITSIYGQMQPVVSNSNGEGNVDWGNRVIVSKGIGAPPPTLPDAAKRPAAIRAAKMMALRNALETVKGMTMNSTTTVENFMTSSDVVTTRVNGFLQGFRQKGRVKYMSDGSVEVTMEIPLDGINGLGSSLLGDDLGEEPSVKRFDGEKSRKKHVFSGLIIDCRGLGLKPALSPKVYDENGKEVYGSAYVSKEWATKYGIVGYAKTIDGATKIKRAGDTPGAIKAVQIKGENGTDVVISNSDAEDVRSASENLKFLSECRVILVLD